MRVTALVLPAIVLLLASCTATVAGTAEPAAAPDGRHVVVTGKPCELLTPAQAEYLHYAPEGEFTAGEPAQLMPPVCYWSPAYDDLGMEMLSVEFSVDISIADYTGGGEPVSERQAGGLTWRRYLDEIGGEGLCRLVTELSPTSFVAVVSSDLSDERKSCEQAEAALPYVASHLPGGQPAPAIEPQKPSPLASVDPCSLVAAEDAERLGYRARNEPAESPSGEGPQCNWVAEDGDRRRMLMISVEPERPAPEPENEAESVEASGHVWRVYPTGIEGLCAGDLAFTERSYVRVTVSEHDEAGHGTACDMVKQVVPLVTEKLPEA